MKVQKNPEHNVVHLTKEDLKKALDTYIRTQCPDFVAYSYEHSREAEYWIEVSELPNKQILLI